MDADEPAGSRRRTDLNLYLRPLRPLPTLGTPMPSWPSSSAASVDVPPAPEPLLSPYSLSRGNLSRAPLEAYSPYIPYNLPAPGAHLPNMPPPEQARYRRLLEQTGTRWLSMRRLRSDLPPLSSEIARLTGQDSVVPMPRREPVSNNTGEVNKVTAEESTEDQGKTTTATFECNICFDMASEPVVTSCGHLFCWPCLYQWLNVYSSHKECPVYKGEVTEANVTPIYGRGNSDGEKTAEDVKPPAGTAIPPRPHGNRRESFRQQFHNMQPIPRRLGEAHTLTPWRRLPHPLLMTSASGIEGSSEAGQEVYDSAQHTGRLSRLGTQNNEPTIGPTHVAGGPSAHQAYNSSTVAVRQGDAGISESAGQPSNAGSSRSLRISFAKKKKIIENKSQ